MLVSEGVFYNHISQYLSVILTLKRLRTLTILNIQAGENNCQEIKIAGGLLDSNVLYFMD